MTDLYTGADRGTFNVMRLMDNSGVQIRANARMRDVTIHNYLSDYNYAVIGYSIEWWKDPTQPPHLNGETHPYIPRNRPNINKLYCRGKTSVTPNLLYLEDLVINDFLNEKNLKDPMLFKTHAQEAAEQVGSAGVWRVLDGTDKEYRDGVHITRYSTTPTTPLTPVSHSLSFKYRTIGSTEESTINLTTYPFSSLRETYDKMREILNEV